MHVIQSTFQRWTQELSTIPQSVLSKFHSCCYLVFPLLSLSCVVLTVTTHRTDAGLVVIAILSALYESVMCCSCMKKQVTLGYGLWLHAGVAMIFSGFVALEYTQVAAAGILLCFGFLLVVVVLICFYLGHDVLMEDIDLDMTFPPPPEQYWV